MFSERYSGIGMNLYSYIQSCKPQIFQRLSFYKKKIEHIPDSFAYYDGESTSFAIQMDPDCDVIIIWNSFERKEFGSWDNDINAKVVAWIDKVVDKEM